MPRNKAPSMLLYRLLSLAAHLAYAPWALLRAATGGRRPGDLAGRLGLRPYPDLGGGYWVHAVSVGEVGVARTLLAAIERADPAARRGLSVTTAAGRELAERRIANASVFAFPFDLETPVRRALDSVRPGVLCLTETEIWPLIVARARERGTSVALVNGRISERSYPRYRAARRFLRPTLERFALFAMQSAEDARRIAAIGAPKERILVTGNIKYDIAPAPPFADGARLRSAAMGRPIVVAASTAEGEEDLVLEALRAIAQPILLAIAPRRPERFEEVARRIERSGARLLRRSASPGENAPVAAGPTNGRSDVYLLDSIGELASLYGEAKLAVVGGSFQEGGGGHNPIEAWERGVPVITGPHMSNFRDIAADGEAAGILRRAAGAGELGRAIEQMLSLPEDLAARAARARAIVEASRGAAEKTAAALSRLRAASAARE
ncbi:MAG TPA: glycosyltransferase N-terminal domain-containing protein [Thermoanaerobaculia bacterium]